MAGIPFKTEFDFEYGRCDQLSPLIRRVIANNSSPFTFTGTGTYIIGTGNVAVIDPGPLLDAHVDAILDALGPDEQVSHIVVTHTHLDHSPASKPLQDRTKAPIYSFAPPRVDAFDGPRLEEDADDNFAPDHIVAHGDLIKGDNWTLECVFTPGHMANHMCYALVEEKALFTGDHVMGWSTSVIAPPDGNMNDYMQSLDLLLSRDDDIYWPTHGTSIDDPKAFVRAYIEHRRGREEQIISRLKAGDSDIRQMVETIYADVDKRLHPAAALSVFAHIQDLLTRGEIACDGKPSLDASYQFVG
jgi:glyoxylase-like metal-dependent hydrolase (beta-lactamase superfamily II)